MLQKNDSLFSTKLLRMSKKNSIFAENFAKMPKDIAFILYNTPEHSERVQVVIREETLWMTQKAMAELFGCSPDNISLHLKNIYEAGELQAEATSEKISVVQTEGSRQVNRATLFYNLVRSAVYGNKSQTYMPSAV